MDFLSLTVSVFLQIFRNTLWASALATALALVWRWLPGWARYGLGLLVVCRLLMPAEPVSSMSASNWWHGLTGENRTAGTEASAAGTAPVSPIAQRAADPVHPGLPGHLSGGTPSLYPAGTLTAAVHAATGGWLTGAGALLWLSGALAQAAYFFHRQRTFGSWWKTRRVSASPLWQDSLADCLVSAQGLRHDRPVPRPASGLKILPGRGTVTRRMQIWEVPGLGSPLAAGIFRPCILVPSGLGELLESSERAHILQHELAHHRHHDLLWNFLTAAACTLHWFNPLVRTGVPRLFREREILRDAEAIRLCARPGICTGGITAAISGYGATLLKLLTLLPSLRSNPVTPPPGSAILGTHHLKQRLTMIPQHISTAKPASRTAFAAAAVTLTVLTFTRAEDKDPSPTPASSASSAAVAPAPEPPASPPPVIRKLSTIVIPRMQFSNASLREAVDYLRFKSIELDKEAAAPDRKGIDIVIKGGGLTPGISCDLRNITLLNAIKTLCELSGFRYRIEPGLVFLSPADEEDKSLQTRVFRINDSIARNLGWRPGRPTPPRELLSNLGIDFPEGATATLHPETGRLVVRLTMRELDHLEMLIDQASRSVTVAGFHLASAGISGLDDSARILTPSEFADHLKIIAGKSPHAIVRLQCQADVPYDKVAGTMETIRAAGLKNVDVSIRDDSHGLSPSAPDPKTPE